MARKVKELVLSAPNKVGMLLEVGAAAADSGVNIQAICAYVEGSDAVFRMVTEDNDKAKGALSAKGYKVDEREVVAVDLEDKAGSLKEIAGKFKDAGIDLDYCYGSAGAGGSALFIFNSKDNDKAISLV